MDAGELGIGVGLTALGGGLLWVLWRCWTGRWRGWAGEVLLDTAIRCLLAPTALIVLGAGLGQLVPEPAGPLVSAPPLLVGIILLPVGFVTMFLPRRWWGPRWYRRLTDQEIRDLPAPGAQAAARVPRSRSGAAEASQPSADPVAVARTVGPGYSTAVGSEVGVRTGATWNEPSPQADPRRSVVGPAWTTVAGWAGHRPTGRGRKKGRA